MRPVCGSVVTETFNRVPSALSTVYVTMVDGSLADMMGEPTTSKGP